MSEATHAVVLPLRARAVSDGSGRPGHQGLGMWRHEFEDALARITDGIFDAGLALQAALAYPADDLRQAAERSLDLLDWAVRDARDAVFAGHRDAAAGQDDAEGQAGWDSALAAQRARHHADRLSEARALRTRCRAARAQSQELRAHTRRVAILVSAAEDRVAATLGLLAASSPGSAAQLQVLSQAASGFAWRLRQFATQDAAIG